MPHMNKEERTLHELENYVRELQKANDTLEQVQTYLKAHANMNAALHCTDEVIPPPLYGQVKGSRDGIRAVLRTWKRKVPKLKADDNPNIENKA